MNEIKIDRTRDSLFDALGLKRLKDSYMMQGEVSPQERFAYVSKAFASNPEHAQRLYDYSSKHWLSYSTPILSFGRNKNGLPISCFVTYLDDSSDGLVNNFSEVAWLSMLGGGVGIGVGIRGTDDKSSGVMPHLKTYDASTLAYKQGSTRRGSYAAYLDISHPDIIQFLDIRKPTGDQNMRCQNLHHGINITDKFMQIIEKCMVNPETDDSWELIQPHNGKVVEVVSAKYLWQKILELRMQTGEPYLHFIDTANKHLPQYQKNLGLKINSSQLCNEISLATSKDRTAVCCLSSVNLEYWDEWKDNKEFLHDILEMLDNVLDYFIENAPDTISRAKFSAMRERSVGVGALGFHAMLQSKMIPFESAIAKSLNKRIFKHIQEELTKANETLTAQRGSCPDAKESGVSKRISHLTAIAPNASSSIIMGNTSPSIEPYSANVYRQDTSSGAFFTRNKFLSAILEKMALDKEDGWLDDIWSSVIANDGSVQHLDFLDDYTKSVFKTAIEIDQLWVIDHAADRQEFIDQSQSLNMFFQPSTNIKYLHACHFLAWKKGLKGLYYLRSDKIRKADKVGTKVVREKIEELSLADLVNNDVCLACE